ncbi:uncharacterized protein [Typha angustifolia]|uniref:uncharacterized protein isoform X1 n=1 Tax=Typha angustifolia TaxID=59011 RepID=UPI003C2ED1BB
MPIEMPKGLPFSVDTWTPASNRKRYHFLTHAHKDHLAGIATHASYPIYATGFTKTLALHYFPQLDESLFVELEVGESVFIDDPEGAFSVTAYNANHCPGAAMFLFEGEFGNLLHTGDSRLTPDCLQNLPLKYIAKKGRETVCHLDYLFLDCTFGRCSLKFPSKQSSIQQVISCIWKHPHAPVVYLACDLLGQEEILVQVSQTFGSKIFVDKTINSECFQALSHAAPEILSHDSSCRFQVVGFPRLCERASQEHAEARVNLQPEPLFLRPSTQWYASNARLGMTQQQKPSLEEAEKDEFGVWHVCFSMHSSRAELECALQLLQPKWVISTTPPCLARELSYVKKHCFKPRLAPDDPLLKLFKVPLRKFALAPALVATSEAKMNVDLSISAVGVSTSDHNELQTELLVDPLELKLDLSPPSSELPITLFGRARLGLQDYDILKEEKTKYYVADKEAAAPSTQHNSDVEQSAPSQEDNMADGVQKSLSLDEAAAVQASLLSGKGMAELNVDKLEGGAVKSDTSLIKCSRSCRVSELSTEQEDSEKDVSYVGSSKGLNASLRKLYRSMNVPVPRPLPSLVELKEVSKRVKVGSGSNYSRLSCCYSLP